MSTPDAEPKAPVDVFVLQADSGRRDAMQDGFYVQHFSAPGTCWLDYNQLPYGKGYAEDRLRQCRSDVPSSKWRLIERTVSDRIVNSDPSSAPAERSA